MPYEFVDWRSVRQGGLSKPITTRFYDARQHAQPFEDLSSRIRTLGASIGFASIQPGGHQPRKEHEAAVWQRDVEESPRPSIDCFIIWGCGQAPYVDRERPAERDRRQRPFPCQGCSVQHYE
ncbi:uncharacterized protein LOC144113855 isoform X4 [Amblyomma americanum]